MKKLSMMLTVMLLFAFMLAGCQTPVPQVAEDPAQHCSSKRCGRRNARAVQAVDADRRRGSRQGNYATICRRSRARA